MDDFDTESARERRRDPLLPTSPEVRAHALREGVRAFSRAIQRASEVLIRAFEKIKAACQRIVEAMRPLRRKIIRSAYRDHARTQRVLSNSPHLLELDRYLDRWYSPA